MSARVAGRGARRGGIVTGMASRKLLTQNSELRPLGVRNWSIPALTGEYEGRVFKTCPNAGACAALCYARSGTYMFSNVRAAHNRNLAAVLDDPAGWAGQMIDEVRRARPRGPGRPHLPDMPRGHLDERVAERLDAGCVIVRVHDSGDYFDDWYMRLWGDIARECPGALFYAYTKEVSMYRRAMADGALPWNLLTCLSMGGKEDRLIDTSEGGDYHAEVFPTLEALEAAGYIDQEPHDMLCVVAPSTRVGIVANNIPHLVKRQGERTFGEAEHAIRPT